MRTLRHRLEYAAVAAFAALVRALPMSAGRACGTVIGLAFYTVDRSHRRLAIANLSAAFPSRPRRANRAVARSVFEHFGRLLVELLKFSSLPPERMRELVEVEGAERVHHAHAQGKGVLFITGHFGFWEIHAIAHALEFHPIGVLARALDNPGLDAMLEQVRTCTGNSVIHRRGAARRVLRALAANQGVAVLIDQHIQDVDAVYVDFFNRPVATTSALGALALRSGAPVIPVFALRLPGGRYRLIYEHAVRPPSSNEPEAIREFTQRCTDVLEMYVRRYPELWLWMHRRWREPVPGGKPDRGMFPVGSREEPPEIRADD